MLLSSLLLAIMPLTASAIPHVLVYTATRGYRHDSIPTAIQVLGEQAARWNVTFEFSEDENMFTNETLSGFDGVMFVSNSEEVLDANGQAALQTFFQSGGVYTGVHAASACLFNDQTYLQAVGAWFDYHPVLQPATFLRLNTTHPATANVPDQWRFEEEVYNFRSNPRDVGAVVLLTVDESSYTNNGTSTGSYPSQGDPHPIAWYIDSPQSAQPLLPNAPKAGRSFYTSLGHLNSTWQNETFIDHVMSGLTWALEGASTKAYGVGLVGNSTGNAGTGSSSSATGSMTSAGATGTAGTGSGTSASASGASGAASSQGTAGHAVQVPRGAAMALGVTAGLVGLGMATVL